MYVDKEITALHALPRMGTRRSSAKTIVPLCATNSKTARFHMLPSVRSEKGNHGATKRSQEEEHGIPQYLRELRGFFIAKLK